VTDQIRRVVEVARELLKQAGQLDHGQIAGAYFAHLLAPSWGGSAAERIDWIFNYIRGIRRNDPRLALGSTGMWMSAAQYGLRFSSGRKYLSDPPT
jgi:hypothetical protein